MLKDNQRTTLALPPAVKADFDRARREVERQEERNVTNHEFLSMLLAAWADMGDSTLYSDEIKRIQREGGKE